MLNRIRKKLSVVKPSEDLEQFSLMNKGRQVQFYNFWEQDFDTMYWNRWFAARPVLFSKHPDWTIGMFSVFGRRDIIHHTNCDVNFFYSAENLKTRSWRAYSDAFLSEPKINLSIGFEYFDDERYCRFPNWMDVFFVTQEDIPRVCSRLRFPDLSKKDRFVSLVCSHDRDGLRTEIMDSLGQIDTVSCPGKFRHNDDTLKTVFSDEKTENLKRFYFNICPENSNAFGYVTEKLFQAIFSGCIPVYWGSYNRPELDVLNRDAIIFWNRGGDNSSSLKLIEDLMGSPTLMKEFLSQPRLLSTAEEYISDCMASIERKMEKLMFV